ncbi:MAG: hypothetical protein QOD99_507 [Chthoniobacter sp.]|nr:hypothetical protein [Chthoniobacter sp.]
MSDWRDQKAPEQAPFRRNFFLVAAIHLVAFVAIWFFTRAPRPVHRDRVTWLDGGSAAQALQAQEPEEMATPDEVQTPAPDTEKPEVERPKETTPSEIVLPGATASPTPESSPTPSPAPTPKPTPKSTPKPTPKPSAKPSPKTTPKAKPSASPKISPKSESSPKPKASPTSAKSPGPGAEKKGDFLATKGGTADKAGTAAGSGGGSRGGAGHAGGGNQESDFGWYHAMIHDRFYGRWDQPTSIISSSQKFVATVKIRIEKDGSISDVSLANPSGNVVMDESVMAAARRVTQIDPLPAGLGNGDHYEVKINFELSQQSQ